jgi:glycosyltransferase involved in cell wall biosynthesis
MKYPFVLFYRLEKYSEIDNFFIDNNNLNCTITFISNIENLNGLFNPNNQILMTYGDNKSEYENIFEIIPHRFKSKWIHLEMIPDINVLNNTINNLYIYNCLNRTQSRPIFSIFTSTYNSYKKIFRAYDSLKKQTLNDWEWVIIDDSPDDEHFTFLKNIMINDNRVRLYRRSSNSGNIGNVKNETISLCRGTYVLELDHDDEILKDCLQDAVNVFESDKSIGFVYMDFANIHENGNNFSYGDHICFGYGGYYCQKYNNKWVYVYITPNINNITLSYLIACPNHPRIWRRDYLLDIGNYCEHLPICDDYEILLRTAITTKIAKIPKLAYLQYMNDSNNNFSLIRNSEINRIGPNYISPIYYNMLNIENKMKELNAHEDVKYKKGGMPLWLREETYEHKYCNKIINLDYDCQYCIVGLDSLLKNMDRIKELYKNTKNDFIVLENKCSIDYLSNKIDYYGFDRMKIYTFMNVSYEILIKYFNLMYKSVENYEIINENMVKIKYNTELNNRHDVINYNSSSSNKYLEIGVEYGITFNNVHFNDKTGVDPDPKLENLNIVKKTSDDYFSYLNDEKKINILDNKFDICFIDGMHHCENVMRDFNNCLKHLNNGGKIFIDDILPINYDEQLQIPHRHYYENNILKYGEPWTGDVWKFIYYLLKHHEDNIILKIFNNINYRGICLIEIREHFDINEIFIDKIKKYDYFNNFSDYVNILNKYI